MTEHNCPVESCSYSTDSNRGLSIHASAKHPNVEHDFTNKTEFTCPYCKNTFKDYKSTKTFVQGNAKTLLREGMVLIQHAQNVVIIFMFHHLR